MVHSRAETDGLEELAVAAAVTFILAFPVASGALLILGLPYVLWLRSRGSLSVITVCSGAAGIGAVTFALFSWAMAWNHEPPELEQYLYGAGFGLASGFAFCVGAGPNSSSKPKPLRGSA